jgi:hypothetical protein
MKKKNNYWLFIYSKLKHNAHSLNNVTITLVSQEEECTIR